jgi:hypothetical protein
VVLNTVYFVQFVAERDPADTCNFLKKIFIKRRISVLRKHESASCIFAEERAGCLIFPYCTVVVRLLQYVHTIQYCTYSTYDQLKMASFPRVLMVPL